MEVVAGIGIVAIGLGVLILKERDLKTNNTNTPKNAQKLTTWGIVLIVGGIICFMAYLGSFMIFDSGSSSSSKGDRWDSLSKEEKQWYERNYGGGKSEQYRKAIDEYKSSH